MDLKNLLDVLIEKNRSLISQGHVATYIPELAKVDPKLLGTAIVDKEGKVYSSGDSKVYFAIESISKTVVLALALLDNGEEEVFKHVHKEPSGDPFNSIKKLETEEDHLPRNPYINPGAIMMTSLIKGKDPDDKFNRILNFMKRISEDDTLTLGTETYLSEKRTGDINRALAYYMKGQGVFSENVEETLDVYFRQCSINVTVETLAKIAGFFARGGVLTTGERVISQRQAQIVTGLIATCGMYDQSGEFLDNIGFPGKSGVGGGILCPLPSKEIGVAVFGPAIDKEGNSTGGMGILKDLSDKLNYDMF
ncbi:L-glutaminase [Cetobacterium ceti]|uniref:Glutaminase n=1 Tax=Cetobacterium ceti TaxID=180163 RepID=A0A1T4QU70_9FUSO|nr:glutaminase A [Cetobacterium ceti]SKA07339.1 L-glutaminase [Cetobacterium ceti]